MNAKAFFALSLVAVAASVAAAQPAKVAQDLNLKFDEKYHAGQLTVSAVSKQASAVGVKPGDVLVSACSLVANIRQYNEVVTMAKTKGLPLLTYGTDKAGLVRGLYAPLVDVATPTAANEFGLVVANKDGLNALDLTGKPVKLKAGEKLHSVCAPVSTIAELNTLIAPFDARGQVPGWQVENILNLRREDGTEYSANIADAH